MSKITLDELVNTYSLRDGLLDAMVEAKKQGFEIWVSYLEEGKEVSYFETEYNGLWGYVERNYFGGYSVSMPIKPSQKHGSALSLGREMDYKEMVGSLPFLKNEYNTNNLIGTHKNYNDTRFESNLILVTWDD